MSMPSGVLGKCKPSPPAERAQKELRWPIWPPLFTNAAIFSGIKTLINIFLMKNIGNRVVAAQKEDVVDYDIFEALNMTKSIDMEMYNVALEVSI